jgi:hypothetical protein
MEACRAAFVRGPLCGKAAATDVVPHARIQQWCLGGKSPRAWEVAELLPGLLAQDAPATLEWASACLGIRAAGLELVRAPEVEPHDALVVDGLQLAAACGVLAGEIARAAIDGAVTREERVRIAAAARPVVREALEIGAQVAL